MLLGREFHELYVPTKERKRFFFLGWKSFEEDLLVIGETEDGRVDLFEFDLIQFKDPIFNTIKLMESLEASTNTTVAGESSATLLAFNSDLEDKGN